MVAQVENYESCKSRTARCSNYRVIAMLVERRKNREIDINRDRKRGRENHAKESDFKMTEREREK